ncbi:MAG: discoidin domain-containing protein [Gammaproteobacteria bacterium]|nr:MAG: discoidin domain-containing protein [Gammaproteobacteria bacterium]
MNVTGTGRYVRLNGTLRGTGYGYSLWEFEVYGTPAVVGNKALNKPAVASSNEGDGVAATFAVDGNSNTRWASQFTDAQWIYVDLGAVTSISRVSLLWESAYGKAYNIQVSNDAVTWTTIKSITNGDGGIDDNAVSGSGRYVRVQGVTRGTGYGYSLWNFEVY